MRLRWLKRTGALILSMLLVLQVVGFSAYAAAVEEKETSISSELLQQAIDRAAERVAAADDISEWGAIGLYRADKDVPSRYVKSVEMRLQQTDGTFSRITDYERVALGVMAAGLDPTDVFGYNLIEAIYSETNLARQGANGVIFALLILSIGDFDLPSASQWTEEKLIEWLLDAQNADGGWAIVSGQSSSIDITAMALAALAPYQEQAEVNASLEKAVGYLSNVQRADGSFPGASAEAVAQVIVGLTSIGIHPEDERFTKEKGNALSYLMSMQREDGGFAHLPDGDTDAMATEQGLLALVSLKLWIEDKPGLYEGLASVPVSVYVEGIEGPLADGAARASTALEAVERMLSTQGIAYEKEVFSFGTLITSIEEMEQGTFGGYDGWLYAIKRDGSWIHPMVGIDSFELEQGDQVWLYYGDNTMLIKDVSIEPSSPKSNEPIAVQVLVSEWDWEANEEKASPAANVTVTMNGVKAVTNEEGIAQFSGLLPGEYIVEATGYQDDGAPTVVRSTASIFVRPGTLADFTDEATVSGWARQEVSEAIELGLMQGTRRDQPVFAPKRNMTRAEFAALLANVLELDVSKKYAGSFEDVAADSWFGGVVAALTVEGVLEEGKHFRPSDHITREDMAVWTAKALGLEVPETHSIQDSDQATASAFPYIAAVAEHEIIVGYNHYFRPNDPVTREAAAAVAVRIAKWVQTNKS